MAIPTTRLHDLLSDVLTAVTTHYGEAGVDLPERRYVSPGLPAWDCEQLTVFAERTDPNAGDVTAAIPNPMLPAAGYSLRTATVSIELARCVPTLTDDGAFPDEVDIDASSQILYADHSLLMQAVIAGVRSNELPRLHTVALGGWEVIGPEGGFVAGRLTFSAGLQALGTGAS